MPTIRAIHCREGVVAHAMLIQVRSRWRVTDRPVSAVSPVCAEDGGGQSRRLSDDRTPTMSSGCSTGTRLEATGVTDTRNGTKPGWV